MAADEKERVDTQASQLGPEGLEKKGRELKEAMAKNEVRERERTYCYPGLHVHI